MMRRVVPALSTTLILLFLAVEAPPLPAPSARGGPIAAEPDSAAPYIVTLAGGGPHAVQAKTASIGLPVAATWDAAGNAYIPVPESGRLFFGCPIFQGQNRLVKVDSAGRMTVIAGSGPAGYGGDGGSATAALLNDPYGVAVDGAGNVLVSDSRNHRIRRVEAASGIIQTVAGNGTAGFGGDEGPATEARINLPRGLTVDGAGNLFVADSGNCRVRRVDAASGEITTIAGNGSCGFSGDEGPAAAAGVNPWDVALDSSGNLYIGDGGNHRVRRVDAVTGVITTVAGNGVSGFSGDGGPATSASLRYPQGVSLDASSNLYIADLLNNRVRKVDAATGTITSIVTIASLQSLEADGAGNLLLVLNHRVGRWTAATQTVTTVGGNSFYGFSGDGGPAISAVFDGPFTLAGDDAGNVFVNDGMNRRIRRISAATGIIETVAGGGAGGDGVPATSAALEYAQGIHVDSHGNLFIAQAADCEYPLDGHTVRRVDAATGIIATVAGNGTGGFSGDGGPATSASLNDPQGLATDASGNLFIADAFNFRVRRVDSASGVITTFAGNGVFGFGGDGGPATAASLRSPSGLALDTAGSLFIADRSDHRIRRVDLATGIISTVAGTGVQGFSGDGGAATSARLSVPSNVAVDGSGRLLIADNGNYRIRSVDLSTGIITTLAGTGAWGFSGDTGPAASAILGGPLTVAALPGGVVAVADLANNRVRLVTSAAPPAGRLDADPSSGLAITATPDGGTVTLSWPASCLLSDTDYEVHEGTLGDFGSHAPRLCTTGGSRVVSLSASTGDRYYLVVPRNLSREGSYGRLSDGSERPPAASSCLPQEIGGCP